MLVTVVVEKKIVGWREMRWSLMDLADLFAPLRRPWSREIQLEVRPFP